MRRYNYLHNLRFQICIVLTIFVLSSLCSISINATSLNIDGANETIVSKTVEYFDDGNSVIITIAERVAKVADRATAYSKSGSKTYTMCNSSGNVLWKFTVHGTFSVNAGVSATCTKTSYSTSNIASGWSLKTGSSYASGNKAIGDGTFEHKVLFIVTETKSCHVVLTCDVNGNLS